MLKTAYYRFRSKKKMDDGYDVCLYGSLLHFKKGDFQCGVELATMLLDAYVDDAVPVTAESRRRLKVLLGQFPHTAENMDFVNAMQQIKHRSLKWLSRYAYMVLFFSSPLSTWIHSPCICTLMRVGCKGRKKTKKWCISNPVSTPLMYSAGKAWGWHSLT